MRKSFTTEEKLFLFQTYREKYDYAEALDWISIVGLSLSILCLVVTIGHHIKEKYDHVALKIIHMLYCTT